jgi:ribosome biogenesis GTPase
MCFVDSGGDVQSRTSIPGLAIGDRVHISGGRVREILPRRTVLSRPDPHNPNIERVLAANVDIVAIICSLGVPPLRAGLIDRYLVAVQRGGARAVICVNKIDLLTHPAELEPMHSYRQIGVPVVLCSAETGSGLEELATVLAGNTCVFTGHSGVGKSSLMNALWPELKLATGTVGIKGRHTTSASSLHLLPRGTILIDTPGIREFGLWRVSAADLASYFPEFREVALRCRFRDCRHLEEPDCAVRAAGSERYASYRRIARTLQEE